MTHRCSSCGINYPTSETRCQVCDDRLDYFGNDNPDPDWREQAERQKAATAHRRSTTSQVETWRLEQLLAAGYDLDTAERLAAKPWHEVDLHQAVELAGRAGAAAAAAILL